MVVATPWRLHEQKAEAGCCGPHLVPSQPWPPPRPVIAHVHLHAPEGHRRCRGPDLPRVRARLLAAPRSRVAAAEAKIIPANHPRSPERAARTGWPDPSRPWMRWIHCHIPHLEAPPPQPAASCSSVAPAASSPSAAGSSSPRPAGEGSWVGEEREPRRGVARKREGRVGGTAADGVGTRAGKLRSR